MDITSTISEIKRLYAGGDAESACRLSGEALAYCDNLLRSSLSDSNIKDFLTVAKLHATTLMLLGMQVEATSCLLITLCTADIHGATAKAEHSPLLMDLCVLMLMAMNEQVEQLAPSEEVLTHAAPMLAHSGILLQHYYGIASQQEVKTSDYLFAAAEQTMAQFGEIPVNDPALQIDGQTPDPSNPKPLLAEIIGNASAIGLLQF